MRYVKVCGEFQTTGLFDETTYEPIWPEDLGIPKNLVDELARLVDAYAPVIAMVKKDRDSEGVQRRIAELDQIGLKLTKKLREFLGKDYQLRYYSEGCLRFME